MCYCINYLNHTGYTETPTVYINDKTDLSNVTNINNTESYKNHVERYEQ